ncbi:Na,K-Atpase Interacting protein [Popillia japonica]|uniref:Sodium/potassium-transporting ATPase subunit beta-1-interacting protein n=1 Tax=Popillia japonica TaxID=7064 RepID=A0AAW1KNZ8_POPJA
MGFCTQRYLLLSVCLLQLFSIVQRQVFDFLGYLWIPILLNFFQIIFVIFGFFGSFQYRPKYIISYSVWQIFWLGWNVLLICLYLDIGILNHKESKILKLDPDSGSWWENNGPGCKGTLNTTTSVPEVTNCLVDYRHVEIFQAGLQCFLALFGIISGFCLSSMFLEEDDSFNYLGGDGKHPQHLALQPMYVDSASYPLNPIHFTGRTDSKNDSLLSLESEKLRVPIVYNNAYNSNKPKMNFMARSDMIRYQSPVHRANSYDMLDSQRHPKFGGRPKSLYAHTLEY